MWKIPELFIRDCCRIIILEKTKILIPNATYCEEPFLNMYIATKYDWFMGIRYRQIKYDRSLNMIHNMHQE